jgi:hypothetical protein
MRPLHREPITRWRRVIPQKHGYLKLHFHDITVRHWNKAFEFSIYRQPNWICHIFHSNCLLNHVTQGKIQGMGRWGGRRTQLVDGLREKSWYRKLIQDALDRTLQNSLWNRRWICRKRDCVMNEWKVYKYKLLPIFRIQNLCYYLLDTSYKHT